MQQLRARRVLMLSGLGILLVAGPVVAHHAFSAEFDAQRPLTLRGTVTKVEWINPHSWIHIDVKQDGKVVRWAVECGAPNMLLRRGWNKNSLPVGTEVVVNGFQAKNGSSTANGRAIILPDGQKLFAGSSGTGAPRDGKDPTER